MSKTQVKSNDRFSKFRMESPLGKFFTILLYVVMTIIVLIVLLPVLHIIAASFSDPQAMISGKVSFWPKDFTLRGYEAVFTYKKFWTGFRNSLFYMVFGTFINIVMTLLCAYPLSRKEFTARNKVAMFFVFTMYFSGGMVPSFMLVNALGLVDTIWAMLIPGAMSTYNMIIARTYMINSIPDELYEAAEIDGCTPFKYLIRIVVPLSKPIIAVLDGQCRCTGKTERFEGSSSVLCYRYCVSSSYDNLSICSEILRKGCYDRSSKGLINEKCQSQKALADWRIYVPV